MANFILAMFGFYKESRKEIFTLSTLKITIFIIMIIAITGYLEGI